MFFQVYVIFFDFTEQLLFLFSMVYDTNIFCSKHYFFIRMFYFMCKVNPKGYRNSGRRWRALYHRLIIRSKSVWPAATQGLNWTQGFYPKRTIYIKEGSINISVEYSCCVLNKFNFRQGFIRFACLIKSQHKTWIYKFVIQMCFYH